MVLSGHMVFFMNPGAVERLKAVSGGTPGLAGAWIRDAIDAAWEGLRRGDPQPEPLGERRGSSSTRRQISIRCAPEHIERAQAVAAARGVSVSRMLRDIITRTSTPV